MGTRHLPAFGEQGGRRPDEAGSVRERVAFGGKPAPDPHDEEHDQVSVASSSPPGNAGGSTWTAATGTAKGRGIRVVPTTDALRGAAWTTAGRRRRRRRRRGSGEGRGPRRNPPAGGDGPWRPPKAGEPGAPGFRGSTRHKQTPRAAPWLQARASSCRPPRRPRRRRTAGAFPTRTRARSTRARGGGDGGTPARGRAAPLAADGGTGANGIMTGMTHGPGGTGTSGLLDRAGTVAQTARARSLPTRPRHSSAIRPGRNGSRSSSPTPRTPPTRSSGRPGHGRSGYAASSSPSKKRGTPSIG